MRKISKFADTLEKIIAVFSSGILLVMTIFGVIQVVCRYFLKISTPWSEELMRYLYVWITFLGVTICIRSNSLSSVTSLVNKLSATNKPLYYVVSAAIWLIQVFFYAILFYFGLKYAAKGSGISTSAMALSMYWFYVALPVCSALSLFMSLVQAMEFITKECEMK